MEYVFLEASLFLDVILNALISNYFDNKPIDGAEPKDGSRLPVELSVLIWYGNLLEDIYNKRLIHDSIGTNLIRLNRYKTEFENKKLEVLKDSAGAVFMKSIAENIRGRKSKV